MRMRMTGLYMGLTFAAAGEAGAGAAADTEATTSAAAAASTAAVETEAAGDDAKAAADQYAWFGAKPDDDQRAYLDAKSFKGPQDLYKSLRGAEKLIRGDQIPGPPEDAEKHAEWLKESGLGKRLGIPDDAAGYKVEPPVFDDAIKGMVSYDDNRHGRLLDAAHKMNLTPGQVDGVLKFYASEMGADAQAYTTEAQADEQGMQTTLKREWGEGYTQNVQAALEVAAEVGLDATAIESLRLSKVIGSTQLTKILHELAVSRGNDTLKGGGKGGAGGESREQSAAALAEFTSKNAGALTDRNHPEHASAFRRMQELKKASGRGSV